MRLPIVILALVVAACGSANGGAVDVASSDDERFICNGVDERTVLDELKRQGAVLTNEREAVFYFYGDGEVLSDLEAGLRPLGFSVRPTNTDPGRVATMNVVVDEDWLGEIIPKICKLSNDLGVEYDGWEASIPEAAGRR